MPRGCTSVKTFGRTKSLTPTPTIRFARNHELSHKKRKSCPATVRWVGQPCACARLLICLQGCREVCERKPLHPTMWDCLLMARRRNLSRDGTAAFLPSTTLRLSAKQKYNADGKLHEWRLSAGDWWVRTVQPDLQQSDQLNIHHRAISTQVFR